MSIYTVWKITLPARPSDTTFVLPDTAKVLSAQMQHGSISVWLIVDPARPTSNRRFRVVGTGHPFKSYFHEFVGTVQDGDYVWHVFEVDHA